MLYKMVNRILNKQKYFFLKKKITVVNSLSWTLTHYSPKVVWGPLWEAQWTKGSGKKVTHVGSHS